MPDPTNPNPTPETPDDLNQKINQIVSSHIKRFEKSFGETFAKTLDEKLAGLKPAAPESTPAPEGGKAKGNPELAAMQARIDDTLKALEAEKKRVVDLESKRRDDSAKSALRAALKDVRPELLDVATEYLFNSQKRVTFDEDGRPLFKVRRSPASGLPEEDVEMPLEEGAAHWLKSKDAAGFLPAPTPTRAGGRGPSDSPSYSKRGPGGRPVWDSPAKTDAEKVQRAMEMERWIQGQQKLPSE